MKRPQPQVIDLSTNDVEKFLHRVDAKQLRDEDYEIIKILLPSYVYVIGVLRKKSSSIGRLKKMLFGASTEKTEAVIGEGTSSSTLPSSGETLDAEATSETDSEDEPPKQRKGHGRNGADAYHGAEKIPVPHPSLEAGDACPDCQQGKVYEMPRPGVLIRIVGQAPVQAKVYQRKKLRCNLCGKIFTAPAPEGVGPEKYDATVGSMIALLKYGSGLPFNRFGGLQGSLGIPLPASTQWDIIQAEVKLVEPACDELIRQAAQGDVVYNDDTTIKILDLMGKRAQKALLKNSGDDSTKADQPSRTGLFTSGIVSTQQGRKIALFFSGRQHAGENLTDVLVKRATTLAPPIQMCDGLSRNLPAELETILANCLAHSRRRYVDVAEHFSKQCEHVLLALKVVYKNDAIARKRKLSPEERLRFHQAESGSIMADLQAWLQRQFDDRLVEPNSGLGEAITYMLKHWEPLTLFLRKAGAPLDNNVCERALKKAILHRKNSLFFKSENGAHTADVFMSLIYTCEFCGANPFDYLTELQRHAKELASAPENWMPWNYRQTLDTISAPAATAR